MTQGTQDVLVTVGKSSVTCPVQSDWPKSLWRCSLPDDVILSNEGDFPVTIDYNEMKEDISVMC